MAEGWSFNSDRLLGKRRRVKQANLRRIAEQQLREKHELRETLKQQQDHMNAELHRARLESFELARHEIGQPLAVIEMRLSVLKQIVNAGEQLAQIELCRKDLDATMDVLNKLRTGSESNAASCIRTEDCDNTEDFAPPFLTNETETADGCLDGTTRLRSSIRK